MSVESQIYAKVQRLARDAGRPFAEYLTLYAMECFLDRLSATEYKNDFVLKGGVLLAAFKMRRPTSDIDMAAFEFTLDAEHMKAVVQAVSEVDVDDALTIDPALTTVAAIREGDDYSGLRVKVSSKVYNSRVSFHLDISTGDPIWPEPQTVEVEKLLGGDIRMAGYPMPMVIAEKAVTILTRGATSTRWRDVVDLRNFAKTKNFSARELREAAERVAAYRQAIIGSIAIAGEGWPEAAQTRWAAWRVKSSLEQLSLERFEEQFADVCAFIDPVFTGAVKDLATWSHEQFVWIETPSPG